MEKKKILIVEDEPDALNLLKMHLEEHNYEIICAMDGKEGYDKAREHLPDIILLDLMLPKIDGFWVCSMLKSDREAKKIPIIVLTARSGGNDRDIAKQCGADDYVVKPFKFEELLSKIEKMTER